MRMQRVFIWVFFTFLAIWLLKKTACHGCGMWPFGPRIVGSGNVVTQDRSVGDFDEINISTVMDVVLRQGDATAVQIRTSDNLQDLILAKVENGQLSISTKNNGSFSNSKEMKAYITVKNLKLFENTGVGSVTCETPLTLDRFELKNTGVGDVNLKGTCNDANLKNTGAGGIEAADFICKKLSIVNSGVGSVRVHATEEISIENSGVGNVNYSGSAAVLKNNSSGVGSIKKVD